jgi:hypothetical protein
VRLGALANVLMLVYTARLAPKDQQVVQEMISKRLAGRWDNVS